MSPKTTPRAATVRAVRRRARYWSAANAENLTALAQEQLGHPQVERRGDLDVLRRRWVDQDAAAAALDQHGVVGRLGESAGVGQRIAEGIGPERLRRLHGPEARAVQRALYLTGLGRLLDGVG